MSIRGGPIDDVKDVREEHVDEFLQREIDSHQAMLSFVEELSRSVGISAKEVAGRDENEQPARPVTVRVWIDVEAGRREDR